MCNIWHPAAAFLWDFKLEELGSAPISGKIHSINPPSNFFCRKKDQMQKQLVRLFRGKSSEKKLSLFTHVLHPPSWIICIFKCRLPHGPLALGPLRLNSPGILNVLKRKEQIREIPQKIQTYGIRHLAVQQWKEEERERKRNILRQFTLGCRWAGPSLQQIHFTNRTNVWKFRQIYLNV